MNRKAFTLIELLVVISIIALLLAILIPALNKVREQAKSVVCSANIKQLSMGAVLYSMGCEDKTMYLEYPQYHWINQLTPYMGEKNSKPKQMLEKAMKVAQCPSANKLNTNPTCNWYGRGTSKTAWQFGNFKGSYAINRWVCDWDTKESWIKNFYDNGAPKRFYKRYSEARSTTPLFADSLWIDAFPFSDSVIPAAWMPDRNNPKKYFTCPDSYDAYNRMNQMGRFQIDRHRLGINIGFVDGHVQYVKLVNLWSFPWSKEFDVIPFKSFPKY